jgi:hypothetical protein
MKVNPAAEQAALDRDLRDFGVCVAEIVDGQAVRLPPMYLVRRGGKGWYYLSISGPIALDAHPGRFQVRQ